MFELPKLQELYNEINKDHNLEILQYHWGITNPDYFHSTLKCTQCETIFYLTVGKNNNYKHVHCGYGDKLPLELNCLECSIKNIIE